MTKIIKLDPNEDLGQIIEQYGSLDAYRKFLEEEEAKNTGKKTEDEIAEEKRLADEAAEQERIKRINQGGIDLVKHGIDTEERLVSIISQAQRVQQLENELARTKEMVQQIADPFSNDPELKKMHVIRSVTGINDQRIVAIYDKAVSPTAQPIDILAFRFFATDQSRLNEVDEVISEISQQYFANGRLSIQADALFESAKSMISSIQTKLAESPFEKLKSEIDKTSEAENARRSAWENVALTTQNHYLQVGKIEVEYEDTKVVVPVTEDQVKLAVNTAKNAAIAGGIQLSRENVLSVASQVIDILKGMNSNALAVQLASIKRFQEDLKKDNPDLIKDAGKTQTSSTEPAVSDYDKMIAGDLAAIERGQLG